MASNFSNNITFVLEGLPAAGKTTLAKSLRASGFVVVNESLGYLNPARTHYTQADIFNETVHKYSLSKASGNTVIDRGYPSLLAWDYCTARLYGDNNYPEKYTWINKALEDDLLFEPSWYIYHRITPEISLQRRPREETTEDIWSGILGLRYCYDYYEYFFNRESIKNRTLVLDSELSPEQVVDIISKIS